jgi:hypothetical protein
VVFRDINVTLIYAKKGGHDTEESTITLEINASESQLPNADTNQRVALEKNKCNLLLCCMIH